MPLRYKSPEVVTLLGPPYQAFLPAQAAGHLIPPEAGSIMTWHLGADSWQEGAEIAVNRPAGIPLAIVLPEKDETVAITRILRAIERARPQAVLPYHEAPCPREVTCVIRRPPTSLAASVCEYLGWRGFRPRSGRAKHHPPHL